MSSEKKATKYKNFDFSQLNEKFYQFDREELISYKPLSERLSSAFIDYSVRMSNNDFVRIALKYLVHTAYSLFFYITDEKNPSINFKFDSNNSFCSLTTNHIQIGVQLLFDEDIPRQIRVDTLTAIIYHEFYHKKYTIADLLKLHFIDVNDYYNNEINRKTIQSFIDNTFEGSIGKIIHNIFEDRRIESLGMKRFPGYGFSFDVMRKHAFYINTEFRTIRTPIDYIIIYLLYKILLPELSERFYQAVLKTIDIYDAKSEKEITEDERELKLICKVIREIEGMIESKDMFPKPTYDYIYSDDYKDVQFICFEILKIIPSKYKKPLNDTSVNGIESENFEYFNEETSDEKKQNVSKVFAEELNKIINEEIDEFEKQKTNQRSDKNSVNISKLDMGGAGLFEYTAIKIIPAKKERMNKVLFNKAKRLSNNIFKNLGFLDAHYKQFIEMYELTEGEIDDTEIYSINWNKNIFKSETETKGYNLDFGVLLDESYSMNNLIESAKVAFLSLILSLKNNDHINLFAYGHTANYSENGNYNNDMSVILYKYYNTLENFVDINTVYSAKARANNADGFAIAKMGGIMMKSKNKNKILIVISDGQPNASHYSGQSAIQHTKESVEWCERKGITVIQICVDFIEESGKMFKHYVEYKQGTNFFYEIRKILLKQITQFFDKV